MKVLFLDIDGVLNSHAFWKRLKEQNLSTDDKIDPLAVDLLNRITDETGAKIVVSSTWRLPYVWSKVRVEALALVLRRMGVTAEVIGMTPDHRKAYGRGGEIQDFLLQAKKEGLDITSFVILDDDSDMEHLMDHLVKTTMAEGLQEYHVQSAIEILNK